MVHTREKRFYDASCKVIGKYFLSPYVIEPIHGYKVAEPHVGGFVGDELGTGQFLVESWMFAQEHAIIIV